MIISFSLSDEDMVELLRLGATHYSCSICSVHFFTGSEVVNGTLQQVALWNPDLGGRITEMRRLNGVNIHDLKAIEYPDDIYTQTAKEMLSESIMKPDASTYYGETGPGL